VSGQEAETRSAGEVAGADDAARAASTAGSLGGARPQQPEEAIPLARPSLGAAEERAVVEVLRSGQLSLGPKVGEFERAFAQRLGATAACAVSSGTAGLHLALRAAGVGPGDEVVTSPLSFVASANAILYEGARPVFAEIDPVTLNLDPERAAAAITERTRAILPVHLFGYPAEMGSFEELARRHGVALVEDACEALGARHPDGRPVGGRGNLAVFGFYANKQLTTGEGGMVVVGDPALKERIDSERNQGRSPRRGWLEHDRLGFNYRLSDLACALGLAQLERLDELLAARARLAALYREALECVRGLELPCPDMEGARRGWFVFVVLLPREVDRDGVMQALAAEGIESKPYLPAIHLMPFYRERFGHRPGEFPVCEDVAARSLALPFYADMPAWQVRCVADVLRETLAR
jgi:perosamine synthetase